MSDSKPVRMRIVAADFNKEIIDVMIDAAAAEGTKLGIVTAGTVRVPGCYELPFVANQALKRADCDLLVALGYIERGETLHGEVMGHVVSRLLVELSLEYEKPIGIGIIGPGATLEQARARRDGHARAAVRAALACLRVPGELDAAATRSK